jgi:hypothetical protein
MKIAILCEGIEPGRSGVGDYSWRLGAALQSRGHEVKLLGFSDRHVQDSVSGARTVGEGDVAYVRVPSVRPIPERWNEVTETLARWKPDWTSLQFVPYSFHPKGLVMRSGFPFSTTEGGHHSVMVHETWIGLHPGSKLRTRLLGWVQKTGVSSALRLWNARVTYTSLELYKRTLGKIGVVADVLPMFGTLEHGEGEACGLRARVMQSVPALKTASADKLRLVGVFGAIHDLGLLARRLGELHDHAKGHGLHVVICLLGRSAALKAQLEQSMLTQGCEALLFEANETGDANIASMMREMDAGLTTTPQDCIGKSSAVACFRDQGLPVLSCSAGAFLGTSEAPFFLVEDFLRDGLLLSPPRYARRDGVLDAAEKVESDFMQASKDNAGMVVQVLS